MSNEAWAAEVTRICPLAAEILTAARLPWAKEDEYEPGFRIDATSDPEHRALLRISHWMPEECPSLRGDMSIETLRVKQLIEVATYKGVFLATGWDVELKHGSTGPYIMTKPKGTQ